MSKLQQLISNIVSDKVFIQTHNFPDPDAISSAFGLQYLLKINGIDATICYKGKIDRYNTRKMMELFGISATNVDVLGNFDDDSVIVLVDAQKKSGNTYELEVDNVISIDHHPVFEQVDYLYADIRGDIGACASIIASYFFENDIEMPENIATALLYGIKIDTAQMTRGVSALDLDMFYKLFFKAKKEHIAILESNSGQLEDLKAYGSAIESISIEEQISFANTGTDCNEALIAEIADFMVELKDVYFSVVYSVKKEGIKISARSTSSSGCNAGKVIIEALDGIGTGGGHVEMAGGYVSFRRNRESADILIEKVKERIKAVVSNYRYMEEQIKQAI